VELVVEVEELVEGDGLEGARQLRGAVPHRQQRRRDRPHRRPRHPVQLWRWKGDTGRRRGRRCDGRGGRWTGSRLGRGTTPPAELLVIPKGEAAEVP